MNKQDVAFLGFGVGYGEPETMWTETIDRTAEYVFHYAQKLQKLSDALRHEGHDRKVSI